jgi:uncharacterized membrane protein
MRPQSKIVILIGIWCLIVVLVPLLLEMFPAAGAFLFLFFSPICHQLPERSFFLWGHQLPVCARCTGIYMGAFLGSLFARNESPPAWVLVAALVPLGVDGGTQLFFRESTNTLRFVTGIIAGIAVAFYLVPGLTDLLQKK